ncbi:MAG: isopenicillin N synthase family oxygenase [Bauldia sp.]|nr:isopenicillin N synthase family oxygenase [Bauldia sp.]
MPEIATIDIEPFRLGDAEARLAVAKSFGEAFEDIGFAVIVGHGIPGQLMDDTYAAAKAFFDMPLGAKLALQPPEKVKARGYLPMGIESVSATLTGETPPDLCEALVFAGIHRELRGDPNARPNYWPTDPPQLTGLIQSYARSVETLTRQLMEMSALALDLPEDYFDADFADPNMTFRFVNYPDQVEEPKPGQLRYGEHHDYGGLTILRQDSAPGGLQIWDPVVGWWDALSPHNSFVINVGDLMARWTNDRWSSTLHRVINPSRQLTGSTQRLSMVAFTGPNDNTEVVALPTCVDEAHPAKYEPVRAGPYIRSKIAASHELSTTR